MEQGGLGRVLEAVAAAFPRVRVEPERGVIWADGRGLDAARLAEQVLEQLAGSGAEDVRVGVAAVPVVAECAARHRPSSTPTGGGGDGETGSADDFLPVPRSARGGAAGERGSPRWGVVEGQGSPPRGGMGGRVVVVGGSGRDFLAPLPVEMLADERTWALLDGVGVSKLGELAALEAEVVEVRFGPEGVALWRLARAEDARRLFRPIPPERLAASIDFVDYVLTDPARLLFTANALLSTVCERLQARGEHARRIALVLPLANGEEWRRSIKPARPTASREAWLRLVRAILDRITVSDAVAGMALEVEATEPAGVQQGDLFDRGFATAGAVEAAVARLLESQGPVIVVPENNAHPLPERRTTWVAAPRVTERSPEQPPAPAPPPASAGLSLQLLPEPRRVMVDVTKRRDHVLPVRLRDRTGCQDLVTAAGPDRISGGRWDASYAREYFRCVTADGVLLWLYRDAQEEQWYLHGWWD
ncbi:MAG: hypothetical protein P8099_04135 [Gemmatimonadota bacterium]